MRVSRPMSLLLLLSSSTLIAQEAKVAPLMSKDLAESQGKEGVMITVEAAPVLVPVKATATGASASPELISVLAQRPSSDIG